VVVRNSPGGLVAVVARRHGHHAHAPHTELTLVAAGHRLPETSSPAAAWSWYFLRQRCGAFSLVAAAEAKRVNERCGSRRDPPMKLMTMALIASSWVFR